MSTRNSNRNNCVVLSADGDYSKIKCNVETDVICVTPTPCIGKLLISVDDVPDMQK